MMPKAYQEAINLPGIPMGRGVTFIRGWSDTGKSTLKNLAIANAMKQGILPVIFETEGNFDFQYAKDCGMAIEPVYDDVEYTDEETGEITVKREIVDWEGDYFLFTNTKMCEFCGDMDYSTSTRKSKKRKVAVIEDIAYIINTFLDKQDNGEIPMPLLFIWDSVGSIQSYKSYMSKSGNNQFDAGSISTAFKPIFGRISASKEIGSPYTNTFIVINKIWQDVMNSMGGAVSVENSGGKAMFYAARLGLHCGGVCPGSTRETHGKDDKDHHVRMAQQTPRSSVLHAQMHAHPRIPDNSVQHHQRPVRPRVKGRPRQIAPVRSDRENCKFRVPLS